MKLYKTLDNINLMEMYYQAKKNHNNSMARRSFVAQKGTKEYDNILRQFTKGYEFKNNGINNSINEEKKSESDSEESSHEENISDNDSINDSVDMKPINNLDVKNLLTNYLPRNNNNIIINNNININININNNSSRILNEDNTKISSDNILKNNISNKNNNNISNIKKYYDSFIYNDACNEINVKNGNDIVLELDDKNQDIMDENIDSYNLEKKIKTL